MNACDAIMNAWWQRWFDLEIMTGYPSSLKKRGPTPLEDTVVLLGKRIVHYRVDSSMKINERKQNLESTLGNFEIYLIGDISGPDTLGMTFLTREKKNLQTICLAYESLPEIHLVS